MDDIQRLFENESREKKRIGHGIHNRASRTGNKGPMRTPVDYLKGKEKRDYMGNTKLRTFMILSNGKLLELIGGKQMQIMPYNEFKDLPKTDKIKVFGQLLEQYDKEAIVKYWGLKPHDFQNWRHRLGFSTPKDKKESEPIIAKEITKDVPIETKTKKPRVGHILNGEFSGKELSDQLSAIMLILKEDKSYTVEILINEP